MDSRNTLLQQIKTIKDEDFTSLALAVFHYQAKNNPIYAQFLDLLRIKQAAIQRLEDIPFLPISLFKNYDIQSSNWKSSRVFTSSGTTGSVPSRHLLRNDDFYHYNARRGFEHFYGPLEAYTIFALLPSYLERSGSSLIFMAEDFIKQSRDKRSGFFLHEQAALLARIEECQNQKQKQKILLLGVSFALLDLAEKHPGALKNIIIMETGGMKGRREEITRQELHQVLKKAFGQTEIHSEYGMTELLSQAYSKGEGLFYPCPTLRVLSRELTDPLSPARLGKPGIINIIDLANIDTISFIATEDLGIVYPDHSFEINGRMDASNARGCNLMFEF